MVHDIGDAQGCRSRPRRSIARIATVDRGIVKRLLVSGALALAAFALVAVSIGFGYRVWRQHEVALALAIDAPNGIDEARFVRIGGIEQWVTIRGTDRVNPIVLILAGGPGNSLVPLAPVFRAWE